MGSRGKYDTGKKLIQHDRHPRQTQSSDSSKAAKRVLRSNTILEIDIAEKERGMTIAVGLVNDGCSIRDAAKRVGVVHLKQCIGASLIAKHVVIILS
jgi:hypothetical protein